METKIETIDCNSSHGVAESNHQIFNVGYVQTACSPHLSSSFEVEEVDIKTELKVETDEINTVLEPNNYEVKIDQSETRLHDLTCGCHVSFLMLCPACDRSFKGGLARLPCLKKHISSVHQRNKKKVWRHLMVMYKKKYICRCRDINTKCEVESCFFQSVFMD